MKEKTFLVLSIVMLSLVAIGCIGQDQIPLEGTPWKLDFYMNSAGNLVSVLPNTEIAVQFQAGKFEGSTGCNNYFGDYTVNGDAITIGKCIATLLYCPEIAEQEQEYFGALNSVTSYEIRGNKLRMINTEEDVVLIFEMSEKSKIGVTDPDTLNILAYGEPDQLDPATCYDARGSLVIHNLYDRLIGYDSPDTRVISPRLAESWDVSGDGMEYTFYLRRHVTFHDGSPVTAYAVKYSFDRVLEMNQPPSWMMAQCMDLNSTQVIDNYTVKITLTKPYAAFLPILCYTVASVVNPAVIEANGGVVEGKENEWLNQNETGAGSGPYELVEWIPNGRIVLKCYDNYWRGPAKLPNVKISFIPEIGTRVMYLKKGDADIATGFPETNIPDILEAEGVTVFAEPSFDITFIVLGCRGPLADKKVRQAVCMAMDYDTILSFVYYGLAERLASVIPAGMFGWHNIKGYQFDIDGANALLDEAGYRYRGDYRIDPATGEVLGAEIAVPTGDEVRSQISLLWQNNLAKIGFKLDIREITWAMMYKLIRNEKTDMIISGWLPDYADPDNYTDSMCGSANAKAIWGSDYKNEKLDSLIDQAKWEANQDTRNELYRQILLIIKEDAPFVWLAQTPHIMVMRTWVRGYFYNPCQPMEFWCMYKE